MSIVQTRPGSRTTLGTDRQRCRKMLYVSDRDLPVWDRARALAAEKRTSVSRILPVLLASWIAENEVRDHE